VTAGSVVSITISPASAVIVAGGSQSYTATGVDAWGNPAGNITPTTTFSIAPDGSCTGAVCTATAAGIHTVTGASGGKTSTASLQINVVKNAGFETDLSGWNTSGSGTGVTLTRVAGGRSGGWAAKVANTGSTTATYAVLQDSPNWALTTAVGTYTGTMWVRADSPGAIYKVKFQEYNGATLVGSSVAQITLSTDWQPVTVTYPVKSAGTTLDFQTYVQNPVPGVAFYADDASITLG